MKRCPLAILAMFGIMAGKEGKMNRKLKSQIEKLVGEAYQVGYVHGGNVYRPILNEPPQRVDEGWGQYYDQIIKLFELEIARASKSAK